MQKQKFYYKELANIVFCFTSFYLSALSRVNQSASAMLSLGGIQHIHHDKNQTVSMRVKGRLERHPVDD